jgi:predicted esterase
VLNFVHSKTIEVSGLQCIELDEMADGPQGQAGEAAAEGRLLARPERPRTKGHTGLQRLALPGGCGGTLFVPPRYEEAQPAPLMVALHGARGTGFSAARSLAPLANEAGFILLAPDARDRTWDMIHGAYGPDVVCIDRALQHVFDRYAVDPDRVAAEGFSDGASYALSVGITNGDLFTHIVAFSPGFLAPAGQRGAPRIFISHGTQDPMLRIDFCSRRIVPALRRAGYDVRYQEFEGGHTVPPEIAKEAITWFVES